MDPLSNQFQQTLVSTAKAVEEQLDAEIEKLDRLTEDDLEDIRRKRMEAMKTKQKLLLEWKQNGHGEYEELKDEKEFFDATKKSDRMICHFYRDSTARCRIFDKHLTVLAKKHMETKFCKINAEKAPFLCERLRIKTIPTLALIRSSQTVDYVVGFTELGKVDDFSTELLEWRVARSAIIDYSGDLAQPPEVVRKSVASKYKTIRDSNLSDDSDDEY